MRIIYFYLIAAFLFCLACSSEASKLQPLDLLSQGLPLKINAPADVQITASDFGIMKDVTIKNETGYSIQIFESETTQIDAQKILNQLKSEIEGSKFFSKIVSEDPGGFIFEKRVDENYINYDFRHVKVRGDKQYVIQTGLSTQYTLDQVKTMYKSVQ